MPEKRVVRSKLVITKRDNSHKKTGHRKKKIMIVGIIFEIDRHNKETIKRRVIARTVSLLIENLHNSKLIPFGTKINRMGTTYF